MCMWRKRNEITFWEWRKFREHLIKKGEWNGVFSLFVLNVRVQKTCRFHYFCNVFATFCHAHIFVTLLWFSILHFFVILCWILCTKTCHFHYISWHFVTFSWHFVMFCNTFAIFDFTFFYHSNSNSIYLTIIYEKEVGCRGVKKSVTKNVIIRKWWFFV